MLAKENGFVLSYGALHVRGICSQPFWHSLQYAWQGEQAFHRLYDVVQETDIPFAQDCVGDQFLLRDGHVLRLMAETGETERVSLDLQEFFAQVEENPEEFLCSAPNHPLQPGELLHAYPPFCVKESENGSTMRPLPAEEVIMFHADLARRIADVPDGGKRDAKFSE